MLYIFIRFEYEIKINLCTFLTYPCTSVLFRLLSCKIILKYLRSIHINSGIITKVFFRKVKY